MRFGTRHATRFEREAFLNVAGREAWRAFKRRVEAAATLAQARAIALAPGENSVAGSALYARLRSFLVAFEAPPGVTPAERVLYRARCSASSATATFPRSGSGRCWSGSTTFERAALLAALRSRRRRPRARRAPRDTAATAA